MSQTDDPLTLYKAFREALVDWTTSNRSRFVVPEIEHWPEGVDGRQEACRHYGERYADEIIERLEAQLAEEMAASEPTEK